MRKLNTYKYLIISLSLVFFSPAYADGYVKHVFNNNSEYDCYIILHQKSEFPIDSCLGVIAAQTSKTCEGSLYFDRNKYEPTEKINHKYTLLCSLKKEYLSKSFDIARDHTFTLNRNSQSIEMTWNFNPTTLHGFEMVEVAVSEKDL